MSFKHKSFSYEFKFGTRNENHLQWWYSIVKIIELPVCGSFLHAVLHPLANTAQLWVLVLHKTDHFLSLSVIGMALSWNISVYTLLITWTIIGGNIVLLLHLTYTQEQPQKANYYCFSSSFLGNQYIVTVI